MKQSKAQVVQKLKFPNNSNIWYYKLMAEENNIKKGGHIDNICHLIFNKKENDALALIKRLSNPNDCSAYEQTIYGAAAAWNAISIVKYYVETLKVNVDYAESMGMTPLMHAC